MNPILDLPEVKVRDNDIEGAIRKLKKRLARSNLFSNLRTRNQCRTRAERTKIKQRRAEMRRRKSLRIQQERPYDTDYRNAVQ